MDSRRILLADANATDSDLISTYLNVPGECDFFDEEVLDIHCVSTLDAAIQAVENHRFDVLLLDLTLAESLGLETYHRLRAHLQGAAVIILASHEDASFASAAVMAGAHDLVVKHRIDSRTLRRAVGYAIERNKRQLAELEIAGAGLVQRSILSTRHPYIDGLDTAAHCEPACTVGGDFYDFVQIADGKFAMVLGDVSGHGLGPALLMAETRGIFRTVAQRESDPGALLTEINRLIESDCCKGAFITMFLAVICPATGTLRFATAGHEGYLLSARGEPKLRLASSSPPLGILPDHTFESAEVVDLAPNDIVFACTDGLTDSYCPERKAFFGMDGIFSTLSDLQGSAQDMIAGLFMAVKEFQESRYDDMTAIIARTDFPTAVKI